MNTPWGQSQHVREIAPGIMEVSTASHGGLHLSRERWDRIAALFPTQGKYAPSLWLEEDCDWALAALAWPECFPPRDCYYAVRTFSCDSEYCAPTKAWLATPAADLVKARAALFTAEDLAGEEARRAA